MTGIERYRSVFINNLKLEDSFDDTEIKRNETKNWDSVGHISLISDIEDEFGVMFEMEDILNFKSYSDGLETLRRYGVELDK